MRRRVRRIGAGRGTHPATLSELLCILGAEGCVVDVDLRFSEARNSKLRAIICIK